MRQITRNNHYVPEWYQYDFHVLGQSRMPYLNLQPEKKALRDGRVVTLNDLHHWGPKKCFCQEDLYTTYFGTSLNDEVEKFLFGAIDKKGSQAVRAFVSGDAAAMHYAFEDFFEYMDAQKLRTPKGLDWLKTRYAGLDQMQLMREMQSVRMMHCTLWTEGVREIVSAKNSDVKFIVTDHPVTVFNAGIEPTAADCNYPHDPSISLIGSQTLFALNQDTCLILTHLEYAKDPKSVNLVAHRTNARYRGKSYVRTDAFIKGRELDGGEVLAINFVLKSRAKQFVAAADKTWLFPEKQFDNTWKSIAEVLLPPKAKLSGFGGETYIGFKDGTTAYNDAFGRTSKSHEYLTRKRPPKDVGPDDPCGCGSQIIFERCCRDLPENSRPSWKLYSIRERNLMFSRAVQDVLGMLDGSATWEDVRRDLSGDQVKRIHELFASLWPEDTDVQDILPRPNRNICRAIYMGITDPRTIVLTILGWLPFVDQIILAHPFANAQQMSAEFSPTQKPNAHKAQTLKNVFTLLLLEPFIEAGVVHLIPDPGDFNAEFRTSSWRMAEDRTRHWEPNDTQSKFRLLAEDDHKRLMRQMPDESLARLVRKVEPQASEELITAVIERAHADRREDPFSLLQDPEPGEAGAQLLCFKGYNLESMMFLASATGSFIYADDPIYWDQIEDIAAVDNSSRQQAGRMNIMRDEAETLMDVNPVSVCDMLNHGQFDVVRKAMKGFEEALRHTGSDDLVMKAWDEVKAAFNHVQVDIPKATHKVRLQFSAPADGFQRTEVNRLLLTFADRIAYSQVVLAVHMKLAKVD